MANEKHLAILKQGVDTWNAWRKEHPDVMPDLSGANLYGAFLADANLVRANLARANLVRANLARANLQGAFLAGANLTEVNLAGANLQGAFLEATFVAGAFLAEANLAGANLEGTNLEASSRAMGSGGGLALLTIPLHVRVPAGDLGLILNGLAELYAVVLDENRETQADALIAHRIAVGTPNEVDLIGMLPQITAIAAALVAVLRVPKAVGEGAEKIANARKTWIEGSLLKDKKGERGETDKKPSEASVTRIEVAFNALAQGKEIVSGEPTLRIVGGSSGKVEKSTQAEVMPKDA